MQMEHTGCSETLAHKIQTPGNHPKERIKLSEHGKSLESRKSKYVQALDYTRGSGQCSRYSDLLRARRFGNRKPVVAKFSGPVQTGPGA